MPSKQKMAISRMGCATSSSCTRLGGPGEGMSAPCNEHNLHIIHIYSAEKRQTKTKEMKSGGGQKKLIKHKIYKKIRETLLDYVE